MNDNNLNITNSESEVDLLVLLRILIVGKWTIMCLTTIFSIVGIIISLLLPNIYESKAILVSTSTNNQSSLLQNYGTLANIAGIDIPNEGAESNALKALEKLNTLSFFESNIMPNIFLPNLMGLKYWNAESNSLEYDNKIYNLKTNSWVRNYSYPQKLIPSAQESFNVFQNNHLSIYTDQKTNFITIKIKHQSPYIAKKWTELFVNEINSFYRIKDKNEAEKAINYLNGLIANTNLSEIRQVIASLLQQETQKLTLIMANDYYVFEYIDPPAVMEEKSLPSRALICILAALLGVIFSTMFVLIMHYISNRKLDT